MATVNVGTFLTPVGYLLAAWLSRSRLATKKPIRRPQEEQKRPIGSRLPQFVHAIQL